MVRFAAGQRALRRGRVSLSGQIYLITAVTAGRQPIFRDFYCGRIVVREMQELEREHSAATMAFVVMPDHFHWLMQLNTEALAAVVARLKGRSARRVSKWRRSDGRIWQPGYHDHALRCEESLAAISRYIVANPVRAQLVRRVGDYPLWDCQWL
jgi:REP element-mobilizing transposase RayT